MCPNILFFFPALFRCDDGALGAKYGGAADAAARGKGDVSELIAGACLDTASSISGNDEDSAADVATTTTSTVCGPGCCSEPFSSYCTAAASSIACRADCADDDADDDDKHEF